MRTTLIQPDSKFFDIGANTGQSAIRFMKLQPLCIVSVEPCIENFILLSRLPFRRVIPIHALCGAFEQIGSVHYCFSEPGTSTAIPETWREIYPNAEFGEVQYVPVVSLDSLRNQFGLPNIVKVDVEGSELSVIEGMSFKPDVVFFEFHRKMMENTRKILQILASKGFKAAHYVRDEIDLVTIPTTPIKEFFDRLKSDDPEWGNITVI